MLCASALQWVASGLQLTYCVSVATRQEWKLCQVQELLSLLESTVLALETAADAYALQSLQSYLGTLRGTEWATTQQQPPLCYSSHLRLSAQVRTSRMLSG